MKKEDKHKARELFRQYNGSRFYMSRDGVESTYLSFHVPKDTEAEWLAKLTAERLQQLNTPGNWGVVTFLLQHSDFRHVTSVLAAQPRGKLWERCAFLEDLMLYLGRALEKKVISQSEMATALQAVAGQASDLISRARSDESRHRIEQIIEKAQGTSEQIGAR